MTNNLNGAVARLSRFLRVLFLNRAERKFLRAARASGQFDPVFYKGAYPAIHSWFHMVPLRHYIVYGEKRGYRPNPDFSPSAYLRYNPDVADIGMSPFYHYVVGGHKEARVTKEMPKVEELPQVARGVLRFDADRPRARFALVAHVYYPEIWPEFAERIGQLPIDADLFVTLTYRGKESDDLAKEIQAQFPAATVLPVVNRGRDILPFMTLVNAGALDGYDAVAKIHTKKSPHREDGDHWRQHLIDGILPQQGLEPLLDAFLADRDSAFWVADGQHYTGTEWWGSNFEITQHLMRRLEIEVDWDNLSFPAGSIYWMKPLMVGLLKAMRLEEDNFDIELAQVDGTIAHALERAMGYLAMTADQRVVQTSELAAAGGTPALSLPRPGFTSAFYLPQFHPIAENDAWWGKGFTEWRGVVGARSLFDGHTQPLLPSDLGFYDLRVTEVMGQQAALARDAGIDAFCVYHYWFDGRRVLEQPLDRLLTRPEIDFPFYLCWANESWRRNWDGLSGEVLLDQTYATGFEQKLVTDSLPYMRDPRYSRPDGTRPRFMIYRPEDMPDPAGSVARMRAAWRAAGIGEVELGAVCFHVEGENPVADDIFDFWVEMPPHGIVTLNDYLYGGPDGNQLDRDVRGGFEGLVYDYNRVIENAIDPKYVSNLPENTICGAMPSWDNTARRGARAHMAYGANPARFGVWLRHLAETRLQRSYRGELFLNAWNEWAEKAVLEPSVTYGDLYLQVLRDHIADPAAADRVAAPGAPALAERA
ncbi:Rhamnan synthesis protein F [Thalassovita gelatinovora]|uniref:glycoside hydrolase family 99-like domain-containing protein n=1 Tax=Thalassovita gelatinovora TaxID=53501 RepID=UPI0008BAD35D|nr:glycoside hydrolase family 99-like domain-containing protein [Thalassovita gelatinovora]QIZ82687.1 glycosyl transferase family 1 [Thalassovita gelatinovora]SER11873.1 Rhamnan synthesis protein F [Thalassovita gelatinovora]